MVRLKMLCSLLTSNLSPGPPKIPLPRGDDVSQLRRVGRDFDCDGFKVQVLLLGVDSVRPGGYVLQAERAVSFCFDCRTKICQQRTSRKQLHVPHLHGDTESWLVFTESLRFCFPSISPRSKTQPWQSGLGPACLPTFDLVVQGDHRIRDTFAFRSIQDPPSDRESHDVEHRLKMRNREKLSCT